MFRMTPFPAARTSARSLVTLVLGAILLLLPLSCRSGGGGSGCIIFGDGTEITFEVDETEGFDDFSSTGAALGVAVDNGSSDQGLVIALRFSAATTERTYTPTCDTVTAIGEYDFSELNSVTDDIADDYEFLADGLTDSGGIAAMGHSMNALLFIDDEVLGLRVFIAVGGEITLRRTLGVSSEARVTGDLVFVEITAANAAADLVPFGDVVRIEDIDMTWDTVEQPTAI